MKTRVRSLARVRGCVGVRGWNRLRAGATEDCDGRGIEGGRVEEECAERREDRYDRREDLVNNARPPVVVASSHP